MRADLRALALAAALLFGAGAARAQQAAPADAVRAYDQGRALYARKDFEAARGAFEQAVALAPNDADYHYWLGRALGLQALHASIFSRLGLARKAKSEFERAIALDPRSWEARVALIDYDVRAPGIAGGSKDEALSQARELQRLYPYGGALEMARVLLATGRRDEAVAELRTLRAAYPDSARPGADLARIEAGKH